MTLETNSTNNPQPTEAVTVEAATGPQLEALVGDADKDAGISSDPGAPSSASAADSESVTETGSREPTASAGEALLAEISATVREVARLSQRYHARAEQREGVIDLLRSEVEVLRRGERRGLVRPILADLCRLRGDLLAQAASLPPDFDAAKAADLLVSYAETVEQTLESNGVVTYAPEDGERFDPRLHRRVGGAATGDPSLAGHVAAVRRDGYLDIAANTPIAPAEVTVFAAPKTTDGTEGEQ